MSGTKGSSGFGSQSNEHMDNKTAMRRNENMKNFQARQVEHCICKARFNTYIKYIMQ